MGAEEVFDVVDEHDEVVEQRTRGEVHRLGLLHRAVHILVFNAQGELFLQKRSDLKDCFPGKWDSSASGHLDSGESYDACAVRELAEEIGVQRDSVPEKLYKIAACPETGQEFVWVYRCQYDGPLTLQPEEVADGGWYAPEAVDQWIADDPDDFASGFVLVWQEYQPYRQAKG